MGKVLGAPARISLLSQMLPEKATMLFLNFMGATDRMMLGAIAQRSGVPIDLLSNRDVTLRIDFDQPDPRAIAEAIALQANIPLSVLRRENLIVAMPRHTVIAAIVLVVLQGMTGRFPTILNFDLKSADVPKVINGIDLHTLFDESQNL